MTVLRSDEIEKIVQVIECICKNQGFSVKQIKEKFGLSGEEYEMCMSLAMPALRRRNSG